MFAGGILLSSGVVVGAGRSGGAAQLQVRLLAQCVGTAVPDNDRRTPGGGESCQQGWRKQVKRRRFSQRRKDSQRRKEDQD